MSQLVTDTFPPPDINKPRWDQGTYFGRVRHFYTITNPLNVFASTSQLEMCRSIVVKYRKGEVNPKLTVDELWAAKQLYDSAYHPDTGEKMFVLGRMSCQIFGGMVMAGGLLSFHSKWQHILFWQWANQTALAVINYTNRSGTGKVTTSRLVECYLAATGGAVATAFSLNRLVANSKQSHQSLLMRRLVPFVAISLAHCINIPMMRSTEFLVGIPVIDESGNHLGTSREVPKYAIPQVIVSRICMAVPSFVGLPFVMNHIERRGLMKSHWFRVAFQTSLAGLILCMANPMCCAIFPQKSSIKVTLLEPELQERLALLPNPPLVVYYNKGL